MLCLTAFGMVNGKLKHKKSSECRVQNALVSSAGFSDNSLLNKTSHEKNKAAVVLQMAFTNLTFGLQEIIKNLFNQVSVEPEMS